MILASCLNGALLLIFMVWMVGYFAFIMKYVAERDYPTKKELANDLLNYAFWFTYAFVGE